MLANVLSNGLLEYSLVKTFPAEDKGKISVYVHVQRPQENYIEILLHTLVFVPILSWIANEDKTLSSGTIADLVQLTDIPNLPLLQWELALLLLESQKYPLQSIFPILNGGAPGNNKVFKDLFADARFDLVPKTVHEPTKNKLQEICEQYNIPISEKALKRTVKEVLDEITKNQGCKLCDVGGTETMSLNKCIEIVFEVGVGLLEDSKNSDDDDDDDEGEDNEETAKDEDGTAEAGDEEED
jgi:hypothetical protein